MPLITQPPELLHIITDYLDLQDHSSLCLACHSLRVSVQSRLISRLRRLAQNSVCFAALSIHWSSTTGDTTTLKLLLETTTGYSVCIRRRPSKIMPPTNPIDGNGNASATARVDVIYSAPTTILHTCPAPLDDDTAAKVLTRGRHLLLIPTNLVNRWSSLAHTAVQHAVRISHRGLLRLALSQESDKDEATLILAYVARCGNFMMLQTAFSVFRSNFGFEAWEIVHHTILTGQMRGLRWYIPAGVSADTQDARGRTILHRAVVGLMAETDDPPPPRSHVEVVRLLLGWARLNVNACDGDGRTPLHLAAWAGFDDVVTLLVQSGAAVNAVDSKGASPMHVALRSASVGKWEIVRLLMQSGADVETADVDGVAVRELMDVPRLTRSGRRSRGT